MNNRISKDVAKLYKNLPTDIILPPEGLGSELTHIQVYLQGPEQTAYHGGIYKLQLSIPTDYPRSAPKASFITKIFHPNVKYDTGEICVDILKKNWHEKIDLVEILMVIRCLMIEPNPESSLNEEAGKLFMEEFDEFYKTAKLMNQVHSLKKLSDDSANKSPQAHSQQFHQSESGNAILKDLKYGDSMNLAPGNGSSKSKKKKTGLKRL